MASLTNPVEGWILPGILSAGQKKQVLDAFAMGIVQSLHLDPRFASAAGSLTSGQLQHFQKTQRTHLEYLLTSVLSETEWRLAARALGQEHARHGIALAWIAESYCLYLRQVDAHLELIQPTSESAAEFRSKLTGRLLYDLSMQAEAYASVSPGSDVTAGGGDTRAGALYRALMSAAELVIQVQNERELLDQLCRLLVESELFAQVWVARPNLAGNLEIESIFSTLDLKGHQLLPNIRTEGEKQALAARAWRQSSLQYTNDRLADPESTEIQDFYRKHGLRATAVVPLYRDGDLWALLTLLSHQANIFNPELLELLERIGRLVGHGLDSLDLRQILDQERQHQSWLARHDALTDTLNRRGVIERLEEAISRTRRHKSLMAVATMNLDGFKVVNELHGHPAGDLLLRTVSDRLQSALRQADAVGRLGSDEFVLILEDLDHQDDLTRMLARLQTAVEVPVRLQNGRTIAVRSSTGVTLFPQDDSTPERLLRHADRALYAFKESGEETPHRWAVFHPESDEKKFIRKRTILSLFHTGKLLIHYQPVIDLQTGEVTGVEALARLAGNENSILMPADFLHQFSVTDIVALTHRVLAQSIEDLHRLDRDGFKLGVGINFEPITLADTRAMEQLRTQIETSGLEPRRIILELLEHSDTLSVVGAQQVLSNLKASGARLALDDVGSAYSSLLRIKELPVDVIKLDRSFMIGLERNPRQLRFMMNLVYMVQSLGLDLVAEGVECEATGDALAAIGVRWAQGYAIARPMGFDDLLRWLKRYKPVPWTRPNSVLGTVALQLSGMDAAARILQQRPAFLRYIADRDPDTECDIGLHLNRLGQSASRAAVAHRAWHGAISTLSHRPGGAADLATFQQACGVYEEELYATVLEVHAPQK